MRQILTALFALFVSAQSFGAGFGSTPATKLFLLTNQFGEKSINVIQSPQLTLTNDMVVFSTATTPANGPTGDGVGYAGPGSICSARDTGAVYSNTGTKASPVWTSSGTTTNAAIIAATLTGFSAGAGTVSSADTILQAFQKVVGNQTVLQHGSFAFATETVSAAGAISTTIADTTVANGTGGSFAVTLAAPSSQDGQIKVIKMSTATHTVTMALTNVQMSGAYTPTGTTTLTFTNTGDSAVFMAVGAKWVYLGGSAVAS
jgi:hypothetical protein